MLSVSRRSVISYLAGATASIPALTDAHAQAAEEVSFQWRVPVAHSEIVKNSLHFKGAIETEKDTKGLPLVLIFIGISLLPSLVDSILTLRQKLVQPGLLIDARGPELKIDIDTDLPRATILLVDNNGARIIEPDQLSAPSDLAKVLRAAIKSRK